MRKNSKVADVTINLSLRRVWDDGGAAYEAEGIRGTVYVKKGFFSGEPPATLSFTAAGLMDPAVAIQEATVNAAHAEALELLKQEQREQKAA